MDTPIEWEVLFCEGCFAAFDVPKRPPGKAGAPRTHCDECLSPPRVLLSEDEKRERARRRLQRYRQTPAGKAMRQRERQRRRAAAA